MASHAIPEWLHPCVERQGGLEIPASALALFFARKPTKAMLDNAKVERREG